MALSEIHNKKVGFTTSLTYSNTPTLYKYRNSGDILVTYNLVEESTEPAHIWIGGTHIASGYGQDSSYKRDTLSYITGSYNAVWDFITSAYAYTTSYIANFSNTIPIINSEGYRSMVLKDDDDCSNVAYGSQSIAVGKHAIAKGDVSLSAGFYTYTTNNGEIALGTYNFSNNHIIDEDGEIQVHKPKDNIPYTIFSVGVGYPCEEDLYEEERNYRANAIEVITNDTYTLNSQIPNGSVFIKGIGNYDGRNATDKDTISLQTYITYSYSYSLHFSKKYTDDAFVNLIGGAPETLDTLKEISDYISDNGTIFKEVIDYSNIDLSDTLNYYTNAWDTPTEEITDEIEKLLREKYLEGNITIIDVKNSVDSNLAESIDEWCINKGIATTNDIDVALSTDDDPDNDYKDVIIGEEFKDYNHEKVYNFYNYLRRYEKLIITEENKDDIQEKINNKEIKLYYKFNSSKLVTDVHEIQSSYITKYGVLANVNDNWVSSLGTQATMNVVLRALLTQPEYTKPTINVTCSTQGTKEIGTTITPQLIFTLNNTYINPQYGGNYTNEGLGYTYSYLQSDNYFYGTKLSFKYNSGNGDNNCDLYMDDYITNSIILPSITLNNENNYEIVKDINFTYLHPTYMFFDQLLQQNVQVIATESPEHPWYKDGIAIANTPSFNINARYKYFYGWDNTNPTASTIISSLYGWVPTTGTASTTMDFGNSKHSSMWIAYPISGSAKCALANTDGKPYNILHHTAIVDQNAESASCTISSLTVNSITLAKLNYEVKVINFNRQNGNPGEYIKFTIKRQ